jgi:hypothetical protein
MLNYRAIVIAFAFSAALVLSTTCFGQIPMWSITTPAPGTQFLDNERVAGAGGAPLNNSGAVFIFRRLVGANWVVEGAQNVQSMNIFGFEVWSATLDPFVQQPNNGFKWHASPLDAMHMPIPDHSTWIEGLNGQGAYTANHFVLATP